MEIEYKVSEMIGTLTTLKEKIPNLERTVTDVFRDLSEERVKVSSCLQRIDALELQMKTFDEKYERIMGILTTVNELQFSVKSVDKDIKSLFEEIDTIKETISKPKITIEKLIGMMPSIIAIISFIGFIMMELLRNKFIMK